MAMLISFIVFLGLTETILVALDANLRNALRDEGVRVAESEMNAVRTIPYDNVFNGSPLLPASSSISKVYRHLTMNYTVTRSVADAGTDMKQVLVTVSWTRGARTDNTAFATIVRRR